MKKKKVNTYCLVIDASIARAAGPFESRHPTGMRCRDFLLAVPGICHRMAWSEAIKAEWDKHEGSFAAQWRVSMMNLKKLRPVKEEQLQELRDAIAAYADDENVMQIMLKDVHLVEAATATDLRVASLDEAVRGHFTGLAGTFDDLRPIIWVNPAMEGQEGVAWLARGAPPERSRRLQR